MMPFTPRQLTSEWLTQTLLAAHAIKDTTITAFCGHHLSGRQGVTAQLVRLHLTYSRADPMAPYSLIAKFSSTDSARQLEAMTLGTYQREVLFYRCLAHQVNLRVPRCHYAALGKDGDFFLLLEDLMGPVTGHASGHCSLAQTALALQAIAQFHAQWWNQPDLAQYDWLFLQRAEQIRQVQSVYQQRWDTFERLVGQNLPVTIRRIGEQLGLRLIDFFRHITSVPRTLTHTDFKPAHVIFAPSPGSTNLAVIDWQLVGAMRGAADIAHFLVKALTPHQRAIQEGALLKVYHTALLAQGVTAYPFDQCLYDYRLCLFGPLIQAVITAGSGILGEKELCHYRKDSLPPLSAALLGLACEGLLADLRTN